MNSYQRCEQVQAITQQNQHQNWAARLQLGFTQRAAKTVLSHRKHQGPLMVQRPFYPEGGLCHVYLLHPPGGVVAGDRLAINVNHHPGTEALITTPAAGKIYRSSGTRKAVQEISITLAAGALHEWLPQETILYEGARLDSSMHIKLAEDAKFIGWEIVSLGRPAAGEGFSRGTGRLSWHIYRNGAPLFQDRMHLDSTAFSSSWGLNSLPVCASMFACPALDQHLQSVRELIGENPGRGVTLIDDLLICRASDDRTAPVRRFVEAVRDIIRPDITGYSPYAPRIWAT